MITITDFLQDGQTVLPNILLRNYARIGLTDEEFIFLLQLYSKHLQGDDFPDLNQIAASMGKENQAIYRALNQLVAKGVLTIDTTTSPDGKGKDRYIFEAVWELLTALKEQEASAAQDADDEEQVRGLYQSFQEELGRTLTPLEYERIGQWLEADGYAPELIRLALKEAVLNDARSFKYIEQILLSWESRNIKTAQQVEGERERRRRLKLQQEVDKSQQGTKPKRKISMHNWLEGDGK